MALIYADRVKETTNTSGTGTVSLLGASNGFQSFSSGIGNGNSCYYCIASETLNTWEVGVGTYTLSGSTLSRTTVLASSNAGGLVNFGSETKDVFVTFPALWAGNAYSGITLGSTNMQLGSTVSLLAGITVTGVQSAPFIVQGTASNPIGTFAIYDQPSAGTKFSLVAEYTNLYLKDLSTGSNVLTVYNDDSVAFGNASGTTLGFGSVNATQYYVNGVALNPLLLDGSPQTPAVYLYTSGTAATHTIPSGYTTLTIEIWGGGGGGQGGAITYGCCGCSTNWGGTTGAAGGYALSSVLCGSLAGGTITYTVGAAGVGGAFSNSWPGVAGTNGGTTTVTTSAFSFANSSNSMTATGGNAGKGSSLFTNAIAGIGSNGLQSNILGSFGNQGSYNGGNTVGGVGYTGIHAGPYGGGGGSNSGGAGINGVSGAVLFYYT